MYNRISKGSPANRRASTLYHPFSQNRLHGHGELGTHCTSLFLRRKWSRSLEETHTEPPETVYSAGLLHQKHTSITQTKARSQSQITDTKMFKGIWREHCMSARGPWAAPQLRLGTHQPGRPSPPASSCIHPPLHSGTPSSPLSFYSLSIFGWEGQSQVCVLSFKAFQSKSQNVTLEYVIMSKW